MDTYRYKALSSDGKTVVGDIEAESSSAARQQLRDSGLSPLDLRSRSKYLPDISSLFSIQFGSRIGVKQIALFTQQLATMIGAGVPLSQALSFVASRGTGEVGDLFYSIRGHILEGENLATALSHHPEVFSSMYITSVAAGERAGALDRVLSNLADFLESSSANMQQIKSALMYPAVLMVASIAIVILLMSSVMPGFIEIFEQHDQALPPLTSAVVLIFNSLSDAWPWLLLLVLSVWYVLKRALPIPKVRAHLHRLLLRLPALGHFIQQQAAADVARTLYILTSSGVQLVEALRISINVIGNSVIRSEMSHATDLVEQGESFSSALSKLSTVPAIMVQLVESGEASGKLDFMLKKIADILHDETQSSLNTLVSLIEPLILIFVSGIIFVIVISLLQPIFELNTFV